MLAHLLYHTESCIVSSIDQYCSNLLNLVTSYIQPVLLKKGLYYYDVSNQRDATTFSFINLFNSALHVSGDKFTHPQEHFLTVCTALGIMHRHCCQLVSRSTVAPFSGSVGALYQKLHIQSKRTPEDGRICRPKHVGLN